MKPPRVVVTGLGVVSSVGIGWQAYWRSLLEGRSGISEVTAFDTSQFPTHRGGQIKEFDLSRFISTASLRKYNRASQFAVAATHMALEDAGLNGEGLSKIRVGTCIGTTMAEAQAIESADALWVQRGEKSIPPRLAAQYPASTIATHISEAIRCRGLSFSIGTACAAGNYAISYGCDLIRLGRADIVIAGGADAFSRIAFTGFNRLLAVAPERCQPFDKNRKGMIVGEGSGILILERLDDAIARRVPVYAELLGYGLSCDANHMTIPDVEGVKRVMRNALRNADLEPSDVDYINAHGTGTPTNDRTECAAMRSVFASHMDHIPASSIKSMIGHAMGAASALEAVATVLAVHQDTVPPTINLEEIDPECAIDCVPNIPRRHTTRIALNNSFAFGGNNACVAFGKISVRKSSLTNAT